MSYESALVYFAGLTILLLGIEIMFTYATQGFGFGFSSNRDPSREFSALAMRIKNTYRNQVESATYIVPVLAAASITGLGNSHAEMAALIIILGRVLFSVLYYAGIPFARVIGFTMATFSTLFIGYTLLASGLL